MREAFPLVVVNCFGASSEKLKEPTHATVDSANGTRNVSCEFAVSLKYAPSVAVILCTAPKSQSEYQADLRNALETTGARPGIVLENQSFQVRGHVSDLMQMNYPQCYRKYPL